MSYTCLFFSLFSFLLLSLFSSFRKQILPLGDTVDVLAVIQCSFIYCFSRIFWYLFHSSFLFMFS